MKAIDIKEEKGTQRVIRFERIKPFENTCIVTGVKEMCNITIEYIPNGKVIDIVDYRHFFDREFNELIENIADIVYKEIYDSISPQYLKVTVFLENNKHLTDWSCTIETKKK